MISGTNKNFMLEIEFPPEIEQVNDENRNITIAHVYVEYLDSNKNKLAL